VRYPSRRVPGTVGGRLRCGIHLGAYQAHQREGHTNSAVSFLKSYAELDPCLVKVQLSAETEE
jgi:hypothetical protein